MKYIVLFITTLFSTFVFASGSTQPRDISEYNLSSGLALSGYDPVSYFSEGGGVPLVGTEAMVFEGVTYKFVNSANKAVFLASPKKYEPTYGGWCAYAMASGQKVEINPNVFTINGNRAHFFISPDAKALFDANVPAFERRADREWQSISGERPRK
jgi:hypothetical protein